MTQEEVLELTEEQRLAAMKSVAVQMATVQVLQMHRKEILLRAVELLKAKGITVNPDELEPQSEQQS